MMSVVSLLNPNTSTLLSNSNSVVTSHSLTHLLNPNFFSTTLAKSSFGFFTPLLARQQKIGLTSPTHLVLIPLLMLNSNSTDMIVSLSKKLVTSMLYNPTSATPLFPPLVSTSTHSLLTPKSTNHPVPSICPVLITQPFSLTLLPHPMPSNSAFMPLTITCLN